MNSYKGSYIPKERKVSYKIVVPFLLLMMVVIFMVYQKYNPQKQIQDESITMCRMSAQKTRNTVKKLEVVETVIFNDYGQYGETLGIYQEPYEIGKKDPFVGKTFYLRNICSKDEYSFLMGINLDAKIPIELLDNGFYEVEILSGLTRQRLVSEEVINHQFTSMIRNNEQKEINFYADKNLFDGENEKDILDDNYLFIEVKNIEVDPESYDVILDPGALKIKEDGKVDYGYHRNELTESKEMYDLALGVEKILTDKGLRVKIIRDNIKPINTHGVGGRIEKAYNLKAKYYFDFNLYFSFYKPDSGMTILYSNYASNNLANSLMTSLNSKTDLPVSNFTSRNNIQGVYKPRTIESLDNRDVIRETGGRFLGAGVLHDFSDTNSFAKDVRNTMQTVSIDYGYINDDFTYDTWVSQKEAIIEATAVGILKGLRID